MKEERDGFIGPTKCVMCEEDEENADHFLLQCRVASECWDMLKSNLDWQGPLQNSLNKFLLVRL